MIAWVLIDNKIGSSKQSEALAKIMGFKYLLKPVHYTFWAKIPNIVPLPSAWTIDRDSKSLLQTNDKPDIIISAGRRLARVSYMLKRRFPNSFNIQILKPNLPFKNFDAVILPYHDKIHSISNKNGNNIIRINGAIINDLACKGQIKEKSQKKCIVLLIGGNTKNRVFNTDNATELLNKATKLAKSLDARLLITNSRRTSPDVNDIIQKTISSSNIEYEIYDINSERANPLKRFLNAADIIIVTADSISMCMESIYTNKPVIVYDADNIMTRKHRRFIDHLYNNEQINLFSKFKSKVVFNPKNDIDELKTSLFTLINYKD